MPVEGGPGNPVLLDIWQNIVGVTWGGGGFKNGGWEAGNALSQTFPGVSEGASGWGSSHGGFIFIFGTLVGSTTFAQTDDGAQFVTGSTTINNFQMQFDWSLVDNIFAEPSLPVSISATLQLAVFTYDGSDPDSVTVLASTSSTISGSITESSGAVAGSDSPTLSYTGPIGAGLALYVGYQLTVTGAHASAFTGITHDGGTYTTNSSLSFQI